MSNRYANRLAPKMQKNDGGRWDKSYGLRSGWISPAETPRCRSGSFLFIPPSKRCRDGYPIATESVLQSPTCPKDSLGVFHNSPNQLLASFADKVSGAIAVLPVATGKTLVPPSPLTHARQATLHTAHDSAHRNAGSYQFRTRTGNHQVASAVAQELVSTETGSDIPCHWDAPGILNPQHPP